MPTYTFSRSREQMRDMIARKLGIKEAGQDLGSEDAEIVYEAMNLRLKELHRLGVLWWNVSSAATSIALTGGQVTASIAETDYLFPVSLMLTIGTDEAEVELIGHREYMAITDKASSGEPVKAHISGATIRLYPVPSQDYTAKLTYQAIAADVENGAAVDVPVEMMRSFAVLVAGDLVDDFDLDANAAARLLAQAEPAMRNIRVLNAQRVTTTNVTAEYF